MRVKWRCCVQVIDCEIDELRKRYSKPPPVPRPNLTSSSICPSLNLEEYSPRSQASYQSSEGVPALTSTLSVMVPTIYTPNYHGSLRILPNPTHTSDFSVGAATYGFSVTSHIDTRVLAAPPSEDSSSVLETRVLRGATAQQGHYPGQELHKTRYN
ncbi:hypothetical protein NP493_72g05017 [Ridgeia piscesae]|uniref:Uncharacterized protein n=1 Tax=Ridgeia piscesae TaxID=27915 RepID=A0AAD9UIJ8_RIDPI|nr:hypothetical protein NP493_72g05017 [Ridgeia piscesae]